MKKVNTIDVFYTALSAAILATGSQKKIIHIFSLCLRYHQYITYALSRRALWIDSLHCIQDYVEKHSIAENLYMLLLTLLLRKNHNRRYTINSPHIFSGEFFDCRSYRPSATSGDISIHTKSCHPEQNVRLRHSEHVRFAQYRLREESFL